MFSTKRTAFLFFGVLFTAIFLGAAYKDMGQAAKTTAYFDKKIAAIDAQIDSLKSSPLSINLSGGYNISSNKLKFSMGLSKSFSLKSEFSYKRQLLLLGKKEVELDKSAYLLQRQHKTRMLKAKISFLEQKSGILQRETGKIEKILALEHAQLSSIKNQYDISRLEYRQKIIAGELGQIKLSIAQYTAILNNYGAAAAEGLSVNKVLMAVGDFDTLYSTLLKNSIAIQKAGIGKEKAELYGAAFKNNKLIKEMTPDIYLEKDFDSFNLGGGLSFSMGVPDKSQRYLADAGSLYVEQTTLRKKAELLKEYYEYKKTRANYELLKNDVLPTALKIMRNAEILYKQGGIGVFEFLDSVIKYYDTEIALKRAILDMSAEYADICLTIGVSDVK